MPRDRLYTLREEWYNHIGVGSVRCSFNGTGQCESLESRTDTRGSRFFMSLVNDMKKLMFSIVQLKKEEIPFDNKYLPISKIGGGGFSEVWLATDTKSQVDVVLKIYASNQDLNEEGIKMFRNEFSLVCNLNHANVLKPFTFDIYEDSPYIVLPF